MNQIAASLRNSYFSKFCIAVLQLTNEYKIAYVGESEPKNVYIHENKLAKVAYKMCLLGEMCSKMLVILQGLFKLMKT